MVRSVATVGVVGLGTVGGSLVRLLEEACFDVVAVKSAERAADLAVLGRADVVFEAVDEHFERKAAVLRQIALAAPEHAALVSTTASLSLPALAAVSGRPGDVVGLAFLRPPANGTTVDVVPTSMTSAEAIEVVTALVGQLPLTVRPLPAGPRAVAREAVLGYLNRAVSLYDNGYASREAIDTAMRLGCGLPSGPLALLDELGLDTVHDELERLHRRTGAAAHRPAPRLARMVAAGELGRKTGRGFYTHGEPKAPEPESGVAPRPVRKVGVVGSGTMARGIAHVLAVGGYETTLVARSQDKADAAIEAIEAALVRRVRRGEITPDQSRTALNSLVALDDTEALGACDLVVEATAEDADVKAAVFTELDRVCRAGAVLATSTSSLSVTACAEATSRPKDVVGMHFFNPAPVMRLVEVGRTEFTAPEVAETVRAVARTLGKTPVGCPDRAGFIVNFLLLPYLNDAIRLVEDGAASIGELDAAVKDGFGYPMGPLSLLDTIGLDISEAIEQRLHEIDDDPETKPAAMLTRLVELGRLGRKSGFGFYDHSRR